MNYIKTKVAESWVEGHKRAYPVFHTWSANVARLAEARGWAATELGHTRWVMEGNAKGQEEGAAGRLAVSQMIQGSAAGQSKLALILISQAFKDTEAKLCCFLHDEAVTEVPGRCILNISKTFKKPIEDGLDIEDPNLDLSNYIITPYYDANDEAIHYAELTKSCMEKGQSMIFNNELPGKASYGINPSFGGGH